MRMKSNDIVLLKRKLGVNTLWSYSRLSAFCQSKYEYFLKYIKHEPEDLNNVAYAPIGNIVHSCLEDFYTGKIEYEDMLKQFYDGWLINIETCGLKLDRNDEVHDYKLKQKYLENLKYFFKNHKPLKGGKIICEKFLLTRIGKYYFQGYADCIHIVDGIINIIDFKTSSMYSGKIDFTADKPSKLLEHSAQLVLYAMAIMQKYKMSIEKIKISFLFLKYSTITYILKNGKERKSIVENITIGEKINLLEQHGYEIKDISDGYVEIPLTNELINYWTDRIYTILKDIEKRTDEYNYDLDVSHFWDSLDSIKKDSFYYSTLSGYSANKNPCYKAYLKTLEDKTDENILSQKTEQQLFNEKIEKIVDSDDWMKYIPDITL